jgi:hypothetical protein
MYVSEESDSAIVLTSPSNNDRGTSAEKGDGRPLVKENICEPRRLPTQSGLGLSQGLIGVRRSLFRRHHPRQEPYALRSARTDLRVGQRETAVPTATDFAHCNEHCRFREPHGCAMRQPSPAWSLVAGAGAN